mgnify:CR=1 FL=1
MSELIDNRAQRVRVLKSVIQRLHAGENPEQVRGALKELVSQTDYSEIVQMEQELMAEGMPVEQIKGMCDLHSQVTREVLVQLAPAALPAGHPADTMRRENTALRGCVDRMREAMDRVLQAAEGEPPGGAVSDAVMDWRQAANDLQDIDKHYQRKENLLFTFLEKHGITGPSKVMWAKDDEVRGILKDLGAALRDPGADLKLLAATTGAAAANAVQEMIYKEEHILIPMCLERFTADEWAEIWASSPRYGWCLVEPGTECRPFDSQAASAPAGAEGVSLPTGTLTLEQLLGIFSTLPVDITFVDSDDRVAFFSEGPDRVFARSRAIIGRKVQNCHPPRSVDVVERILSDFREGRQNVAEFWIQLRGRFVHIRYFAVRNEEGRYLGTLEVTQDVGRIRELEGERRLLEYEQPVTAA